MLVLLQAITVSSHAWYLEGDGLLKPWLRFKSNNSSGSAVKDWLLGVDGLVQMSLRLLISKVLYNSSIQAEFLIRTFQFCYNIYHCVA